MKRYNTEDLINAVKGSNTFSDVCRKLNIVPKGGNISTIKKKILELNLNTEHFKNQGWSKGVTLFECDKLQRKSLSEMLVQNSNTKSNVLKWRLIHAGIKEYKCENSLCGRSEWNGQPISLELHHINGDNTDNRIENLQLLCPNCHAQTDNFRGKNIKNKNSQFLFLPRESENIESNCKLCGKPFYKKYKTQTFCSLQCNQDFNVKKSKIVSKEELIEAIKEEKSFSGAGRKFNVSDHTIVKWLIKYNLPTNKKDIFAL